MVSNMTKEEFCANVEKAKEYIKNGDIFQVVLSQRFTVETNVSPFNTYRALRLINPSPYMYYLNFGDYQIAGASPEMLVRVENGVVQTGPIAGTRPRGKTVEENMALEKELLADKKEIAEHTMLVDLGRNDIGRVSEFGSVKVTRFKYVERFSHVMHIITDVEGKLRSDKTCFDALVQHFLQEHFRVHRKSVQWKSLMNLKKRNVQHTAVQSVTLALTATLTAV